MIALIPFTTSAQDGEVIYQTLCAACYTDIPEESIPRINEVQLFDPQRIVDSLTWGVMRSQGDAISAEQKIEIAEYITGDQWESANKTNSSSNESINCPSIREK